MACLTAAFSDTTRVGGVMRDHPFLFARVTSSLFFFRAFRIDNVPIAVLISGGNVVHRVRRNAKATGLQCVRSGLRGLIDRWFFPSR